MGEEIILLYYNAFMIVILLVMQLLIPNITRKNIILGVKIPVGKREIQEIKKIIGRYRIETVIVGITLLILSSSFLSKTIDERLFVSLIFIYLAAFFLVYLRWNKKIKILKKEMGWSKLASNTITVDTNYSKGGSNEKILSNKWIIIPLGIILGNILLALYMYPSLPHRIPTHWDMGGNIDVWMDKSIITVLLMPLTQLFVGVIMYFSYYFMMKSKKQIDASNPEISIKKNIIFKKIWAVYFLASTIGLEIIFTYGNLLVLGIIKDSKMIGFLSLLITGVITVAAIIIGVRVGQGGDRLKLYEGEKQSNNFDFDDDKYWKLGNSIYYNREDPSLFIEKRVGIGWTVNAGRPTGIIIMILPIIIIVVTFVYMK